MQQVNLYRELLKQQQKHSGIKLYAVIFSAISLWCLSFSAYQYWNIRNIESELQQAQLILNQEQAKVSEILLKRPSQELNGQLLTEIDRWQNSVNQASQTLQLLVGGEASLLQGFSSYFDALANQSNTDVWLTSIHIDGQSRGMNIEGSTFKPEQIPQVLQHLQQEPAFKGQTFARLVMHQSVKIEGQMDFILSSFDQPVNIIKDHVQ